MKLTEEHIQQLYTFTRQHYVEWYDVQTELVDHLANGIEEQWKNNSKLTFDEALQLEFKKFGIFGFSDLLEQKTAALNKRYWRMIMTEFKSYFRLPKVILSALLIVVYYNLLTFGGIDHKKWVVIATISTLFLLPWVFFIRERIRIKKQYQITNRKWLFDYTTSNIGGVVYGLNIFFSIHPSLEFNTDWSLSFSVLFSCLVIGMGLIIYVAITQVNPKLRSQMSKLYPEYIFSF